MSKKVLVSLLLVTSLSNCSYQSSDNHSFGRARLSDLGVEVAGVDTVTEQSQESLDSQPIDFQVKASQGAQTLQRATFFLKNYLGKNPELKITQDKGLTLLKSKALDTARLCEVRRAEAADILRYRVGCVSSAKGTRLPNLERSIARFIQSGEMDLNVLE